jgi:hypothetical protein
LVQRKIKRPQKIQKSPPRNDKNPPKIYKIAPTFSTQKIQKYFLWGKMVGPFLYFLGFFCIFWGRF